MAPDEREGGYIKLWRRIESWPLYQSMTGPQRLVVFTLLLGVNWKASEVWLGELKIELAPGEWMVSELALARKAKVSRKVVRVALAKLVTEGFLSLREVARRYGSEWINSPGPGQRVGSTWAAHGHETGPAEGPAEGPVTRVIKINNFNKYQSTPEIEGPELGQPGGQSRANEGPTKGQSRAPSKEGKEGKEDLSVASLPPQTKEPDDLDSLIATWDRVCVPAGFAKTRRTAQARKKAATRLREPGWREAFEAACAYVASEPFYRGGSTSGWVMTFGWLLKPGNAEKTAERAQTRKANGTGPSKDATGLLLNRDGTPSLNQPARGPEHFTKRRTYEGDDILHIQEPDDSPYWTARLALSPMDKPPVPRPREESHVETEAAR